MIDHKFGPGHSAITLQHKTRPSPVTQRVTYPAFLHNHGSPLQRLFRMSHLSILPAVWTHCGAHCASCMYILTVHTAHTPKGEWQTYRSSIPSTDSPRLHSRQSGYGVYAVSYPTRTKIFLTRRESENYKTSYSTDVRIRGAIPAVPQTFMDCNLIKYRDNFTL